MHNGSTTTIVEQTGLNSNYLDTIVHQHESLNNILTQKVDLAHFQSLKEELFRLKRSILDGSIEVEKKKIEEDNGIEIDHHDEYVLGRLAHTDAKLESLSQRMDAVEQNYLKSNLALEKRLSLIELHAQANATEA